MATNVIVVDEQVEVDSIHREARAVAYSGLPIARAMGRNLLLQLACQVEPHRIGQEIVVFL